MIPSPIVALLFFTFLATAFSGAAAGPVATDYSSIQEALDQNPGKLVELPAGNYPLSASLKITSDNAGLFGAGCLVQSNPQAALITAEGVANVQIRDLTLTRAEGHRDAGSSAIKIKNCPNLVLENVQIFENRTGIPTIELDGANHVRVTNCRIENYMRITVDDRTASKDSGFAFNVLDGTGINLRDCRGALLQGNAIVETEFLPTPELKAKYQLGEFCKRAPQKGLLTKQKTWDEGYYNPWHQGSAIVLDTPETNDYIQILGNYIENAAQGVDIHGDHVILSQNIINNSFIGMKAMHGARNIIITGNQFSRNDLWSIGLMPGAASHAAGVPAHEKVSPEKSIANVDGGSIIANNIISDFGYGSAYWMWKDSHGAPIRFDAGQKPINPPLTDAIIQGNIIYDTGRDGVLVDGTAVIEPPRYDYAVQISTDPGGPKGLHFTGNIFHSGRKGVSNVELKP